MRIKEIDLHDVDVLLLNKEIWGDKQRFGQLSLDVGRQLMLIFVKYKSSILARNQGSVREKQQFIAFIQESIRVHRNVGVAYTAEDGICFMYRIPGDVSFTSISCALDSVTDDEPDWDEVWQKKYETVVLGSYFAFRYYQAVDALNKLEIVLGHNDFKSALAGITFWPLE